MGTPWRGERRRWRGLRLLVFLCAAFGVLQTAAVGAADETTIEPAEAPSGFSWKPSSVALSPGGSVPFRNPSKVVIHGLAWTGGPEKPACSGGIPVGGSGTDWSGTCTFAQAGAYTFVCTVHPEEMRGTITVSAAEGSPAPSPVPGQPPEPPTGPSFEALRLAALQRGAAVRGSLDVAATAAGGSLTVELRARRAVLGSGARGTVRVGRLVRPRLGAGQQPFQVALDPAARRVVRRRGRVRVTVKVAVTAPGGETTTLKRKVELRA